MDILLLYFKGFSAYRSSGVFMDTSTRAILQFEIGDSREVGSHSSKMERLLIERVLLYLVHQSPLIVWEIISDASRNIISLLSKMNMLFNGYIYKKSKKNRKSQKITALIGFVY